MDAGAELGGMPIGIRPERLTGALVAVGPELSDGVRAGLAEALAEKGVRIARWAAAGAGDGRRTGPRGPDADLHMDLDVDGPLAYVGAQLPAELRGDPRLVWFHSASAGVDAALAAGPWPEGVLLTRTVGRMAERMAQFVLGWVLAEAQHVPAYLRQQEERVWLRRPGELVAGQQAVVFGAGSIGTAIGGLLRLCGIRTVGIARTARAGGTERGAGTAGGGDSGNGGDSRPGGAATPRDRRPEDFDQVLTMDRPEAADALAAARWVIGALPLTAGTRGYFDGAFFERLGSRPSFLNLGRGAAVDLPALGTALAAGRVRSAVLDVVPEEPAGPEALCWSLPNTVVTSHSSGVTDDEDVVRDFAAAHRSLRAGRRPDLTVDPGRGY